MDDTDSWSHSPFRIYNRPMILRHLFCTSLCLLPDPVFSTGPRVFPTAPASRFPSSLPDMLFLRDSIDAILTIWLPEPFDKNAAVFDVLEIFWMDMGQIAFNLLNLRYLQQDRMPFFPQASCFLLGQAQKSNFEFLDPNVTYFRLFVVLFYLFFFCVSHFSPLRLLSFCCIYWPSTSLASSSKTGTSVFTVPITLIWASLERCFFQKLSMDDTNFGQRWWRQTWNKTMWII